MFNTFRTLGTLYDVVEAITTGNELTLKKHVSIGNQSFNLDVHGDIMQVQPDKTEGAKNPGIVIADVPHIENPVTSPTQIASSLFMAIADLEYEKIGTPVTLKYSYDLGTGQYANATIVITRIS